MASRQLLATVKTAATTPLRTVLDTAARHGLASKSATTPRPSVTLHQKQRPKKKVVHVQKTAVDHVSGDTRLRALFSRPSTSKAPAPIDDTTLLRVIRPVYDKDPKQLDPFLYDIAISLSSARPRPAADEQYITSILTYCWVRANEIKSDRFTSGQLVEIARQYARRLIRLAITSTDSSTLLASLEESLETYRTRNFKLPPSIYAAWAVLRHESGQKNVAVRFIPAKKEAVFKALRGVLENQNENFEKYTPAIEELLLANEGGTHDLPSSPEELDSMLGAMRIGQQTGEVVRVWTKYKERLIEEEHTAVDPMRTEVSGIEAADTGGLEAKQSEFGVSSRMKGQDETTVKSLASFLRFFSRSSATRRLPAEERDLATYRQEVLSFLPKPYPPSIHHALLVHHARIDDEIRPASEVQELDDDVVEIRDRNQVYSQLEATWAAAGREGARDLKSYMLYMEGLAKLGEAEKLGQTWEELVRDQACKDMYLREESSGKLFPPTRALNHMISCAFLIPDKGSSIALDLFAQATQPDSAIPCNIITINTVLRHYARRGVVDSMIALFPLAEKLKLRPDVVTYTVLIQGLLRAGEIKMAAKTLETMQKQGIPPNERTISLLISDLAKEGDRRGLRAAEDLMKEMRRLNMRVGEVPWTSLISGYFRGGWDGDAWTAIKRMEEDQVALNRIGYNMVLRELGKRVRPPRLAEEGHSLLWEMFERMIKRIKPNADTYLIVLIPLVRAKRWDEADRVVKDMKDRGFVPEKSALRAVLNRVKLRKTQWD